MIVRSRIHRWSIRDVLSSAFTALLIAAVVFLWPAALHGSTRLIIVTGHSMEPTIEFGDVVVVRASGDGAVGDTVVFAVPDGEAQGLLVIHRIVDIDEHGYLVTQGDNRDTVDHWQLTQDDIVGKPLLRIPKGGHVIWHLQGRLAIAAMVGLLTIYVLWPSRPVESDTADETRELLADPSVALGGLDCYEWSDVAIDEATMAEASAWLDEQLDIILHDEPRQLRTRPHRST